MRLLVLGGSVFVGRAVVEAALAGGWEVTTFNWDRSGRGPGEVERLTGDRTDPADLAALRGRSWDAVVDTWAGRAEAVRESASLLAGSVGHYGYVSSLMAYHWPVPRPLTEAAPLRPPSPGSRTEDYPARKAAAERAVVEVMGDRALLSRPGLVLGPWEHPGRLPRWLLRMAAATEGEPVLAPGSPDRGVQYVDVRDLAQWILHAAGRGLGGAYNISCPPGHATMGGLLDACAEVTGSAGRLVRVDERWLAGTGVVPWTELPVWVPAGGEGAGIYDVDPGAGIAAGARYRPLAETVADTWAWLRRIPAEKLGRAVRTAEWLPAEREEQVLRAWEKEEAVRRTR
ncbi:NAD-dependent epimerase/dehydratase family protein [Streptomyces sp. NBC_00727]|uniref:NAD-dependent epimerase/dehydratase family protein n=1 Tax=Streptomyces sp. NBC_00727 TaxID=2903675 RepID=UPI003870CE6D